MPTSLKSEADHASELGLADGEYPDLASIIRRTVELNRFMPTPRSEQIFVGDGDFRKIGAAFLEMFIRYGGLRPEWRVLDLGCGIGRMALPLTQFLDPEASYVGVDVNREGITWCRRRIRRLYRNFQFHHIDYHNPLYNPAGQKTPWDDPLPFEAGSFDFAIATSVFTHLSRQEAKAFFRQLSRLLRPGGRLFATFFILDDESVAAMQRSNTRLTFQPREGSNMFEACGHPPRSATAYRREFVELMLTGNGFTSSNSILRGDWSGIESGVTYQDIVVAERLNDVHVEHASS